MAPNAPDLRAKPLTFPVCLESFPVKKDSNCCFAFAHLSIYTEANMQGPQGHIGFSPPNTIKYFDKICLFGFFILSSFI